MQFAPIAPSQHDGSFSLKIAEMATELIAKSASLSGGHTPQTPEVVKELLYYVNCYLPTIRKLAVFHRLFEELADLLRAAP